MTPAVDSHGVTKRFGGLVADDDVSLEVEAGGSAPSSAPTARARPRCSTASRGFSAGGRARHLRRARTSPGCAPHQVAACGLVRTFQLVQLFPGPHGAENVASAATCRRAAACGPRSRGPLGEAAGGGEARRRRRTARLRRPRRPRHGGRGAPLRPAAPARDRPRAGRRPELLLLDEPAAGLNPRRPAISRPTIGRSSTAA